MMCYSWYGYCNSYLGLEDTIDVVYGSSAGTVIGACCEF